MYKAIRRGWRRVGPARLEWFEESLPPLRPGWVTVEVLGCGVCHTDIGYLYEGVPTASKGPLVLGHEIVGRVADDTGRLVLVPAVSTCGECLFCLGGRRTACTASIMPGNHHDGGFATHVQVPSRWLCEVPEPLPELEPWQLSVIADAVTTPYQAIRRARLSAGDIAVVIGVGGIGGFLVELAAALGAHPIALDIRGERLDHALAHGATMAFNVRDIEPRDLKRNLSQSLTTRGWSSDGWHIFECSGTPMGQKLAFQLLTRGSTLSVVGFSPELVPLRLSNLMALDAEAYGNWGCDPALYPEVLHLALTGKINVASAVARFPLAEAPAVLEATHRGELGKRAVLVPHA